MSLKMIHLLAYFCEDGVMIAMHDNHVERDNDYAEAQEAWHESGGDGESPTQRFDVLVPEEYTNADIKKYIQHHMARLKLMLLLQSILG